MLRSGGRFAALDATVPERTRSSGPGNAVWFRGAVPLLGRLLARDRDAYRYLPASTAYLPDRGRARRVARRRRASPTRPRTTMTGGSVQLLTGTRHVSTAPVPVADASTRSRAPSTHPTTCSTRSAPMASRGSTTASAS